MTITADLVTDAKAYIEKRGGTATAIAIARALGHDPRELQHTLISHPHFDVRNGIWSVSIVGSVAAYADREPTDLPLDRIREDIERIVHGHRAIGAVMTTPRGHHGACDIAIYDYDDEQIALVVIYRDGRVEVLPVTREATALEIADASRLAATVGNVTVYYRGRATTARRVEPLQNGFWRADLPGGTAVLYETDPTGDPNAVQHST